MVTSTVRNVIGILLVVILMLTLANTVGTYTYVLNSTSLGASNVSLAQNIIPLVWIIAIILAVVGMFVVVSRHK